MPTPITRAAILAQLQALAEPEYARFSLALIPGCPAMLGVRLPALRRIAKALASDYASALAALPSLPDAAFEERMLRGMVIGYAKVDNDTRRALLEKFLPYLDNWSICDSTVSTCKFMRMEPGYWLPWLRGLAVRGEEFAARFGIVCLLDHFTDTPAGRRETLAACTSATCPATYAQLAIAWAVSIVAVKEPALGLDYLQHDTLCTATHNKAIQKTRESFRATPEYKVALAALRR